MPSPFPGMDPYLEGHLWPDVHQALAAAIRRQLTPQLGPHYVARLAVSIFVDTHPQAEIGIMYPDVEVLRVSTSGGALPGSTVTASAPITAPLVIPVVPAIEVRLVHVEVRDTVGNELVTSIEILSPVNKRDAGLEEYRQKRVRLYQAGVHLLEIDLLRRGTRAVVHTNLAPSAYLITLTRARAAATEVWPLRLQDPLPEVPVPLRAPDQDATLDLAAALTAIYDEAAYDRSIDYRASPPPPALSSEDEEWVRDVTSDD